MKFQVVKIYIIIPCQPVVKTQHKIEEQENNTYGSKKAGLDFIYGLHSGMCVCKYIKSRTGMDFNPPLRSATADKKVWFNSP